MSYNQEISELVREYKGLAWNPETFDIHLDRPSDKAKDIDWEADRRVMNVETWGYLNGLLPEQKANRDKGIAAAALLEQDPLRILEAFHGPYKDLANDMYSELISAANNNDKGKAMAVITGKDYGVLQSTIVLGESTHPIVQGVLSRIWDEVPTPNLRGDWLDVTNSVVFNTNVPDGKSVEPSKGAATKLLSVVVPKHQGAVAITDRGRVTINTRNVYAELSASLSDRRLEKENGLVAIELDATGTTDNTHVVDFGSRVGTGVPYSDKVPNDMWQYWIDYFDDTLGVPFDQIATKNKVFNEIENNDFNKGLLAGHTGVVHGPGVSGVRGLDGVTVFRDKALIDVSVVKMWIMNRAMSGRIFRGPVRTFDVRNDETELTKTVLKSYVIPKILDDTYLVEVSGVAA